MPNTAAILASPETVGEILEAAPNGVLVIDASGSIMLVNRELERMFAYERHALLGQPVELLIPERLRASHVMQRVRYIKDPQRREMGAGRELFGRRADGSEFPIEVGLSGVQHPSGLLAVASIVDISVRKELELTFHAIVEAAPYGMLMVDHEGKIVLVNAQMRRIFGYAREELVGRSIEMLVPERHRGAHAAHRAGYLCAPSLRAMGANRDLTGLHKDGSEVPLEIGLSPMQWNGKTVTLAAVVDISVRKRLELELRDANANLEEFTYVASHDLKSPLRGISDLVEWVKEDLSETPPDIQRNLDRIQIRVERMERIIDDLLTYARARDASSGIVAVNPQEMVASLVELEAPPQGFTVDVEIEAHPFRAARTPLETVLRNLLSNALKHHDRSEGRICIRMAEEDAYCHIQVSDDGPGIPSKAQDRVFKLFQTLSTPERRGSGIGLAVAKRLVESHGGKIELVSREGERGATFHVWWPRFERRPSYDQ